MKTGLHKLAALLMVLALAGLFSANLAMAQKKEKSPSERSVGGVVTEAGGAAVAGAVVQLKNTRTLQVRSFITREKGDYFFHGLSTDVDYELKAESNGRASSTRTLSSFDSKTEATINLPLKN